MARGSQFARALCQVCADVCDACGEECARHQAAHCQACSQACRRCADECRRMVATAA
ncbi:four-helix bundle copper-binding protein [Massilia scottii]|uniref:four-helix bundle copper-binding protein n=1 Tax=Massilia scottii TaxID=3057166 RepID=UPI0027B9A217|nr:four-helix bundle copper-binding protein [Massilia sp. CCM 9210]